MPVWGEEEEERLEKNHRLFWRMIFDLIEDYVDLSALAWDHPLFVCNADKMNILLSWKEKNFKKLGFFKSECGTRDLTIVAGVFLKAKLYAIKNQDDSEKLRAKGITKGQKETNLNFERYRQVARGEIDFIFVPQYTFRSYLHEIYTTFVQKLAASCIEIKKFWFDQFDSRPYESPLPSPSPPDPPPPPPPPPSPREWFAKKKPFDRVGKIWGERKNC